MTEEHVAGTCSLEQQGNIALGAANATALSGRPKDGIIQSPIWGMQRLEPSTPESLCLVKALRSFRPRSPRGPWQCGLWMTSLARSGLRTY